MASTQNDDERPEQQWTDTHDAELDILGQLCSPEAVEAFEMMHTSIRLETAPRFVDLLRRINALSGPGFADRASQELLDVVAETGEIELMTRHSADLDDPIGALALAQLIRTIAENRAVLGESFGL